MKQANTDTTYCINDKCKEKCWRYQDYYIFDKDKNYWFMERCIKFDESELWKNYDK